MRAALLTVFARAAGLVIAGVLGAGCQTSLPAASSALRAPYPPSRLVRGVSWDFASAKPARSALGSDLWPCTWARDDNEYCAWGDGGGFDGNDDHIGRVSLGFARLEGGVSADGTLDFTGKNVWGAEGYAEHPATFGGKVSSLIAVDGILYGLGGLWTKNNTADPVAHGEQGPLRTLVWSDDDARSWHIAPWSAPGSIGSFLKLGRDAANAPGGYVYLYYTRPGDTQHVFLKRVPKGLLRTDPRTPGVYQYLTGVDAHGHPRSWSSRETEAAAIFFDANHVDAPEVVYDEHLRRYLLTVGHYPSGDEREASIARVGIFESRHPWGPWATVGYYADWGRFGAAQADGDYLGLHFPAKWMSADGKTLWGVFSGLHALDSFNVVEARLSLSWWRFLERRATADDFGQARPGGPETHLD